MKPNCIICAHDADFLLNKDGHELYRCPQCRLVFVHPQPTAAFLKDEVYSVKSGYHSAKSEGRANVLPTQKEERLLSFLRSLRGGTFLDVGCSTGDLMQLVHGLGLQAQGVEMNERTARIAGERGFDVSVGTLEEAHYPSESFDIVFMGDVIEHVKDPAGAVAEAHRILKQQGRLIIVTPIMDCFWAQTTLLLYKFFHIPWAVATPPHHLFQFSVQNLRQLTETKGFSREATWYLSSPTLKYALGSLRLLPRWKTTRSAGDFMFMLWAFSLYTIVFVVSRAVEQLPVKRLSMTIVFRKTEDSTA